MVGEKDLNSVGLIVLLTAIVTVDLLADALETLKVEDLVVLRAHWLVDEKAPEMLKQLAESLAVELVVLLATLLVVVLVVKRAEKWIYC